MTAPAAPALSLFLKRLLLRSVLSAEERDAILALPGTQATASPRTDIVSPGQRVSYACLVVEGLAGRFDQMADGRRQTVSLYLPGDMCDLPSVVLPIAAWGITALTASTVLQLPHAALHDVAVRYPAVAMAFWRDTVVDAAVLAKWVANVGRKDVMARLAHLFCEMGERMEAASLGTRTQFRLPLNQEQLADATGLTSVHVNRMLRALREAGVLGYRNQLVEVLDLRRLVAIAEFDDRFLLLGRHQRAAA